MATRTHKLKLFLGLWVLSTLAGPVVAQVANHSDHKHADLRRLAPVDATTTFRGEYDACYGTLHGLQELEYRNTTDLPLTSLVLSLSPEWKFSLDSILQYGVPLDSADIFHDSASLRLTLSQPIPPHQSGFFLLSFAQTLIRRDAKEGEVTFWSGWLPRVTGPSSEDSSLIACGSRRAVPTRSFVDLTVDSSVHISSGGELVNEKEMHGLLPHASRLLEDISSHALAADHKTPYRPVFESGLRRYLFRYDTDSPCPLLVGPSSQVDRITFDSLTVEVVHPPRWSKLDAHRFSQEVLAVLELLQARFGPREPERLMVYNTNHAFPQISETAVGVNRGIRPWSRQRADLVVALTRWWFKAKSDIRTRSAFPQSLVNYLALSTAFELHGKDAALTMRRMYDPGVWPKYRRGSSKLPLTCSDSMYLEQAPMTFHSAPKRWHDLRLLVNDEAFCAFIRKIQSFDSLSLDLIRANLPDVSRMLWAPPLELWPAPDSDAELKATWHTTTSDRRSKFPHLTPVRKSRQVKPYYGDSFEAVIFGDR